jgi:hypothetical protein
MADGRTNKTGALRGIVLTSAAEWLNLELGTLKLTDFEFATSLLGVVAPEDRGGEEACADG